MRKSIKHLAPFFFTLMFTEGLLLLCTWWSLVSDTGIVKNLTICVLLPVYWAMQEMGIQISFLPFLWGTLIYGIPLTGLIYLARKQLKTPNFRLLTVFNHLKEVQFRKSLFWILMLSIGLIGLNWLCFYFDLPFKGKLLALHLFPIRMIHALTNTPINSYSLLYGAILNCLILAIFLWWLFAKINRK